MGFLDYTRNLIRALKGVPFRGEGGAGFTSILPWGTSWPQYPNSTINFAREIGPLTRQSLVMAAANWAGTNLPEAPLTLVRAGKTGQQEMITDHPALDLLRRPTPYYSGNLLWKAGMVSWVLDGNMYFRKVRNAYGQPIELWYEPHFSIRPRWPQDGSEFISFYEVFRNGAWYRIETEDVIHFRYGIDPYNDRLGLSPVASAFREVFTDSERARYSALILRNGGVIPFILSPKATDTELDPVEIKREFEFRTTGDNVGRPMVLSGALDVQAVGMSPDKLLIDKASTIPEERIAALIGIPAAVLGFGAGLSQTKVGATMRELREQAYENFIIPTQRLICPELDVQLLSDYPDTEGLATSFDLRQVRVLQDDQNALANRHSVLYKSGIETRAEARQAFGLKVTPEDDVYFSAGAMGSPTDPAADPSTNATKAAPLNATKAEADAWWLRSTPADAHGLESAEIVD